MLGVREKLSRLLYPEAQTTLDHSCLLGVPETTAALSFAPASRKNSARSHITLVEKSVGLAQHHCFERRSAKTEALNCGGSRSRQNAIFCL